MEDNIIDLINDYWKFDESKSQIENFKSFVEWQKKIKLLDFKTNNQNYNGKLEHSKISEIKLKWSIQISAPLAEYLKTFCKFHGYTMSGFVEGAIIQKISGSLHNV